MSMMPMPYLIECLFHNCILHPIAGVLWACGKADAGDRVHDWGSSEWLKHVHSSNPPA